VAKSQWLFLLDNAENVNKLREPKVELLLLKMAIYIKLTTGL
jgi:hypothetical protein